MQIRERWSDLADEVGSIILIYKLLSDLCGTQQLCMLLCVCVCLLCVVCDVSSCVGMFGGKLKGGHALAGHLTKIS